jgi:hypothetical protein
MAKLSGYYGYDDEEDDKPVVNHSPDPHSYHNVAADPVQSRIVRSSRFPTVIVPSATHEGVSYGFDGRKSASVLSIDPGNPRGSMVVDYSKVTRDMMEDAVGGSSNPAQVFRKLQAQTIGDEQGEPPGTAKLGRPEELERSDEKTAVVQSVPNMMPQWPWPLPPGYMMPAGYPPVPGYPQPMPGFIQAPPEVPKPLPAPVPASAPVAVVSDPRLDTLAQQVEKMGNMMATMLAGKATSEDRVRPRKVGEPLRKPPGSFEAAPRRRRRVKPSERDELRQDRARRTREDRESEERGEEARPRRRRDKEEPRSERPRRGERMQVIFDMGADGGIMKATYDQVINAEELVVLVTDIRRHSDSQWIPGANDQKVITVTGKMIKRDSRGKEILVKSTEHVVAFGFMYRIGPYDHVLLMKRSPDIEPQGIENGRDGEERGN